ncbi:MAG: phosphoglycolate phosphatase [Pseudomonadota bacterium]
MTAFLIDLDGTLIDTAPDIADALFATLDDYRLPLPEFSLVRSWIGGGATVLVQRAMKNLNKTTQQNVETEAFLSRFLSHYRQTNGSRCEPYSGVERTLHELRGQSVALACVTNKPEALANEVLEHCKLHTYFLCVVGGDTCPTPKPNAEPLQHAIKALGASEHNTWMIGDSATDVNAARAAGVSAAWVSYGYHQGETAASLQPDRAFQHFDEVLSLLDT